MATDRRDAALFWHWFLLPLTSFLILHFVLRLLFSPSLEPDDADLVLFGQSLAWGYSDQGPSYSWLLWPLFEIFGAGIVALTILRMLILATICWLIYRCTMLLTGGDTRWSILAAFSPFLVPTFIWHAVIYLTHTNLLCAITLATFYQILRLQRSNSTWDYLWLGILVGMGGLTKYNYLIVALGLAGSALIVPEFRRRILDRRIVITIGIATLMVTPHLLWLMNHWEHVAGELSRKTGLGEQGWSLGKVATGLGQLAANLVLIPVVLVITFGWWFRRGLPPLPQVIADPMARAGLRLLEYSALCWLLWFVGQALLGGLHVHERWLQPFFILLPIYLFARLREVEVPTIRIRRYAQVLVLAAVAVTIARTTMIFVGGRDDGVYPLQMRFAEAAEKLEPTVANVDVIIAADREIGGNLHHLFPDRRTLCVGRPAYLPPVEQPERSCLLVWNTIYGEQIPLFFTEKLKRYPYAFQDLGEIRFVDVPPVLTGKQTNRLAYVTATLATPSNPAQVASRRAE